MVHRYLEKNLPTSNGLARETRKTVGAAVSDRFCADLPCAFMENIASADISGRGAAALCARLRRRGRFALYREAPNNAAVADAALHQVDEIFRVQKIVRTVVPDECLGVLRLTMNAEL